MEKRVIKTQKVFDLNEKFDMPQPHDFIGVLANVHTVIEKTMEKPDKIDLKQYDYLVHSKYLDKQFDLLFIFYNDLDIRIHVPNDTGDKRPCLDTRIDKDLHGKLGFVRAYEPYCAKLGGSFLAKLNRRVLCYFGIDEHYLDDDSQVPCIEEKETDVKVRLFLIKLFKGEFKSWYYNFGYCPDLKQFHGKSNFIDSNQYDINKYYEDMMYIYAFPTKELVKFVENNTTQYELYESFGEAQNDVFKFLDFAAELGEQADESLKSNKALIAKESKLGPFMYSLYNSHGKGKCTDFGNIYKFLNKLGEIITSKPGIAKMVSTEFDQTPVLELAYRLNRIVIANFKQIGNITCNIDYKFDPDSQCGISLKSLSR